MSTSSMLNLMNQNPLAYSGAQIQSALDHNYFEDARSEELKSDNLMAEDEEEEEEAENTGEYMPPGCQGYRVTIEG